MDSEINAPMPSEPLLSRQTQLWLLLFLALVTIVVIFLNLPLTDSSSAGWVLWQNQIRQVVTAVFPYVIVSLLGATVAISELVSTFQTYPREALRTRWARILIVLNMTAATLALVITRLMFADINPILEVLSVGVGFQALIRTRFILAKPVGGTTDNSGEISLNLGWLYDQFQSLCRTQIDLELMNNRRQAVTRLMTYYPSLAQLYDIAWYTIIARATLTPAEEQQRLAELEKLLDPKAPETFARTSIALTILENGGPAYVDLLLDQARMNATQQTSSGITAVDDLVRQMMETYSLEQLVTLTAQLTETAEIRTWVERAAQPDPNTVPTNQKAAIAHFLVQQVGPEAIQRAMRTE